MSVGPAQTAIDIVDALGFGDKLKYITEVHIVLKPHELPKVIIETELLDEEGQLTSLLTKYELCHKEEYIRE